MDNARDSVYVDSNGIKYIELRCNGSWQPDETILPLIEQWKEKTNGYLSVHMPNLVYKEGVYADTERWMTALGFALKADADSFTMHQPRVSQADIPALFKE